MATPFVISTLSNAESRIGGAWRTNTLSAATTAPSTLPRGDQSIFSIGSGITGNIPVGSGGAVMYRMGADTTPYVYSLNYRELAQYYKRYRVLKTKITLSLSYDPQPNSIDQTTGMPRFASVTMFATDDLDSIDSTDDINNKWLRPFAYSHRHIKTKTLGNGHISAAKVSFSITPARLTGNRLPITDDTYMGAIQTSSPMFTDPMNYVYMGFVVSPYGEPSIGAFPANTKVVSGYITVTQTVKFSVPHDTMDFYP